MAAGTAIRYADFGKGSQAVVLLHGYLESLEIWEKFGGMLGKQFRVLEIDLPGHGWSDWAARETITVDYMADCVAAVLEKANVKSATIVGHSMGGYVALALAQRHPRLIEGLVLFHSTPNGDSPEKCEDRLREIAAIEAGKKELLSTINPGRGFAPANLKRCQETIDELSQQIMLTDDTAIIATLKGLMEREDRNDFFDTVTYPTLMIFGKNDNYIPVEAAKAMAERHPKSQVAWLEKSGHMGFIEEPDFSFAILKEFLENEIEK